MKTIKMLVTISLFFPLVLFAQESKIPQSVKKTFTKKFSKVSNVKWDKEGKTYEANFNEGGISKSATFNKEGKLLETETEISVSSLPKPVNQFVTKNYKDYKITGAAKIVSFNGKMKYEAEIKKGNKSKDLMFDKNGNSLEKINKEKLEKEKSEKENQEDEDEN